MINFYNTDCMDFMKDKPDNYYDLAIVDPPYGIAGFAHKVTDKPTRVVDSKIGQWDIPPSPDYFVELNRVSKEQIIWGANNFSLPKTEYFCIWDKQQTVDNFATAEYAWISMGVGKPAKIFKYSIHKTMADRKAEGGKIHPTQKPVQLYKWLLMNYAKEGDKILDTHGGSGSIAIACDELGYDLDICELDKDYFEAMKIRFKWKTAQVRMLI